LEEVQYPKLVLEEARPYSQALDLSLNPLDLGNLHREAVLGNLLNLHNLLGSVSLHKLQASVNQRHNLLDLGNLRDLMKQKPMVVLEDRHT
jgi:hypothetical protein